MSDKSKESEIQKICMENQDGRIGYCLNRESLASMKQRGYIQENMRVKTDGKVAPERC